MIKKLYDMPYIKFLEFCIDYADYFLGINIVSGLIFVILNAIFGAFSVGMWVGLGIFLFTIFGGLAFMIVLLHIEYKRRKKRI